MARNRDLKGIQDGHSRVRQTRFEYRQSCRAGVRIYCPSCVHRLKRRARHRDPKARLAGNPSESLKATSLKRFERYNISKWRFLILACGGPGRTALPPLGWNNRAKGHDRVHLLRPKNMKRTITGGN